MPHTSGPWFADYNEVTDATGTTVAIARVTFGAYNADVAIGNAQLISAAPGMFAALLHIAQILEKPKLSARDQHDMRAIAQLAIHRTVMGGKD